MAVDVRVLGRGDAAYLHRALDEVFDGPVDGGLVREFLADPRHHICVAIEHGRVLGFATAVHYVHPDKQAELWINEVGVAPGHRGRGLGKAILARLLAHAWQLGCAEAWVLTEETNQVARALYRSAGGAESDPLVMVTFDRPEHVGSPA